MKDEGKRLGLLLPPHFLYDGYKDRGQFFGFRP